MSYWKGLALAVAIDLAWIMGCPAMATGPDPARPTEIAEMAEIVAEVVPEPDLTEISRLEDSLMLYLQAHPDDVDAMQTLAGVYMGQGWHEAAIGPLAHALQLDPTRRGLWVALDRAVEQSGRAKITDAELVRRAQDFVETVANWGHGC